MADLAKLEQHLATRSYIEGLVSFFTERFLSISTRSAFSLSSFPLYIFHLYVHCGHDERNLFQR